MGSAGSVDPPAPGQPRATEYFADVATDIYDINNNTVVEFNIILQSKSKLF
jgi:hypothetical protein